MDKKELEERLKESRQNCADLIKSYEGLLRYKDSQMSLYVDRIKELESRISELNK